MSLTEKSHCPYEVLKKSPQVHHFYHKKHFTDSRNKIGFISLQNELGKWVEENERFS